MTHFPFRPLFPEEKKGLHRHILVFESTSHRSATQGMTTLLRNGSLAFLNLPMRKVPEESGIQNDLELPMLMMNG
jgi:hypothetical protein